MAQKTICDLCGADVTKQDIEAFEFRGKEIRIGGQVSTQDGQHFVPLDMCRHCRIDAASSVDDRTKPDPFPTLNFMVFLEGVKSLGPQAAFTTHTDAQTYVEQSANGGEIRQR